MSIGIDVEHHVLHVHTQNGLAKATIKRLQMMAKALVMRTNLPIYAWGLCNNCTQLYLFVSNSLLANHFLHTSW